MYRRTDVHVYICIYRDTCNVYVYMYTYISTCRWCMYNQQVYIHIMHEHIRCIYTYMQVTYPLKEAAHVCGFLGPIKAWTTIRTFAPCLPVPETSRWFLGGFYIIQKSHHDNHKNTKNGTALEGLGGLKTSAFASMCPNPAFVQSFSCEWVQWQLPGSQPTRCRAARCVQSWSPACNYGDCCRAINWALLHTLRCAALHLNRGCITVVFRR